MLFLPHNLLVLIFLPAMLFFLFLADFLINLPKYKYNGTGEIIHDMLIHGTIWYNIIIIHTSYNQSELIDYIIVLFLCYLYEDYNNLKRPG